MTFVWIQRCFRFYLRIVIDINDPIVVIKNFILSELHFLVRIDKVIPDFDHVVSKIDVAIANIEKSWSKATNDFLLSNLNIVYLLQFLKIINGELFKSSIFIILVFNRWTIQNDKVFL